MKAFLIILFSITVMSVTAQRTYTREWKRIDSLIEKTGLIKTALNEVNKIYTSAKKENNHVQVIKSLIYRMSVNDQLSDSGRYENIALLEKEITTSKEPARSILRSITAGSYWMYLQMNRWQFYQRSNTKGYDSKDISTWSLEQLYDRITLHFDSSLSNPKMLQRLDLKQFDPVLIKGNARYLRPTLFDLLAFRALDYYRNDERYITKPAYAFEISDSAAFADHETFVRHRFQTNDSLSLHHRALLVYQQLLSFHANDPKPDALLDADLDRLQFVKNFGTHPDRNELYKKSLDKLITEFEYAPGITNVLFFLAQWYMDNGFDQMRSSHDSFALVNAKQLCEKAIAMNVKNEGSMNAGNLLKSILTQEIQLTAEEVNSTGEPFRVMLQYRNLSNIHIRIIKYDRSVREKTGTNSWEDEFWTKVISLPVIKNYNHSLPVTTDYQQHRIELKIDSLPVGEYGILVSSNKDFTLGKSAIALQHVYVSDISYVNERTAYHVLNRKTGAPLSSARVQVWEEYYNRTKNQQDFRKLEAYTTDKNGFFNVNRKATAYNTFLEIRYGNDILFDNKHPVNYYYYENDVDKDNSKSETILFTDRSIYRPGQTVYFKGIVLSRNAKTKIHSVITNQKSTIILHDNNGQPVDSITLTTNEFGSYSGKFSIPQGLLTGEFSILDKETNTNSSFRVEEYKRPKFQVSITAPKGTYKLNDTIRVEGTAVSYAGTNLNDAIVRFRVVRRANFPMWMREAYTRIWPPYPQEQMEIAHGTIKTNATGKFTIPFKAIPDNKIPRSAHPVFNYVVTADITDMTGETRSAMADVMVAYEAIKINLQLPGEMHTDSLTSFDISTTNLNDSFERAEVKISMHKLHAPDRVFRERYWEHPDQFLMTKEEYYKTFPYDQYANELEKTKWTKQNTIVNDVFTTAPGSNYKLNKKITESGWYVIEAFTKDRFGDTAFTKNYVLLYNDKITAPEARALLVADKPVSEPGNKVGYSLKTNVETTLVFFEVLRNKEIKKDIINTTKNQYTSSVILDDSDRGGVVVKSFFVKHNRIYSNILDIPVPHYNKQLKIDYITFRDKTLPGDNEKWKVKISGMKGDKVAAELLTSMYDVSLDQFYQHKWTIPSLWNSDLNRQPWKGDFNFTSAHSIQRNFYDGEKIAIVKIYDRLMSADEDISVSGYTRRSGRRVVAQEGMAASKALKAEVAQDSQLSGNRAPAVAREVATISNQSEKEEDGSTNNNIPQNIPVRKNLNETAFFFPDLQTDSSGNVEFSFTTPEALTTWKWQLVAHTKDLAYGYSEKSIITQKQLMIQPNVPRFLRAGDSIDFSVKVANMTEQSINGVATLQLFDPATGKEVKGLINREFQSVNFSAAGNQSVPVFFTVKIPAAYTNPLTWRIIATANNKDLSLSDGEENVVPVLSNRMLVTETMTLPVRGQKRNSFIFEKLLNSGKSKTLTNKALTVEFTSNPAWYAVQALPFLSEVKDENAEQIFNRFYANALASKLANSFPKLRSTINKWQMTDSSAFLSNLQKNQDLKNILLEETPWVLEAKTESQQKRNIALLFDMARMSGELKSALNSLVSMQSENGGFVWHKGGPSDRYMTQHIVSGIGHLRKLGAIPAQSQDHINGIARNAIAYIDRQLKKDYDQVKKSNKKLPGSYIFFEPVHYLYMRSFFNDVPVPGEVFAAYNYYRNQVKKDWVKQNTYMRALIALSLQRTGDKQTAAKIIAALKETAITNPELGMYWKDMTGGYYWYQAPIETQAVLIEAFSEIGNDNNTINDLKTWLLKNKQTNNWKTSKSTADACYALLLHGDNWIDEEVPVTITLGEQTISTPPNAHAGSGYFRTTIPADSIKPSLGNITVNIQNNNPSRPAWGGVYWQYFEDVDKVTSAATALKINKKLFAQKNTDRGPVIEALDNNNTLKVGDRIKVRIEIRTDRHMEYVHLKDMRSSAMEPVNVLSEYKWKGGLGYYESTKDASSNFFFSYLPKGTHVFEYDLFVTHTGNFSNGVATIQCMYAPEFSSHSEGIKVNVMK